MYVYIFLQQLERHWVWLFSCAQYKFFHMNNTTVVFVVALAVYIIACCLSFRVCIDLCEFLLNKYNTEHWIAYAIIIYVFIYILVSYIYTSAHLFAGIQIAFGAEALQNSRHLRLRRLSNWLYIVFDCLWLLALGSQLAYKKGNNLNLWYFQKCYTHTNIYCIYVNMCAWICLLEHNECVWKGVWQLERM